MGIILLLLPLPRPSWPPEFLPQTKSLPSAVQESQNTILVEIGNTIITMNICAAQIQFGKGTEEMTITLLFCYTYPDISKNIIVCNVLYAAVQHLVTITLKYQ